MHSPDWYATTACISAAANLLIIRTSSIRVWYSLATGRAAIATICSAFICCSVFLFFGWGFDCSIKARLLITSTSSFHLCALTLSTLLPLIAASAVLLSTLWLPRFPRWAFQVLHLLLTITLSSLFYTHLTTTTAILFFISTVLPMTSKLTHSIHFKICVSMLSYAITEFFSTSIIYYLISLSHLVYTSHLIINKEIINFLSLHLFLLIYFKNLLSFPWWFLIILLI